MDGAGVGASMEACAVQKSAFSAGAARRTGHGAKAFRGRRNCADAAEAGRRGRGRYSDPDHAPAYADGCAALRRTQRRWRSGSETHHANAPLPTVAGTGPKAERTDAKMDASPSDRTRRQSPDCRAVRAQAPTAIPAQGARLGRTPLQIRGRRRDWRIGRLVDWKIGGLVD